MVILKTAQASHVAEVAPWQTRSAYPSRNAPTIGRSRVGIRAFMPYFLANHRLSVFLLLIAEIFRDSSL